MARKRIKCNIGSIITKRRKALGYTNGRDFCKAKNISFRSYSDIEAGTDMLFSTFLRTCKALDCKPEDIIKDMITYKSF